MSINVGYFLKESFSGFGRNFSTTLGGIVTIFLSLFMIGVFFMVSIVLSNVMSSFEDKIEIKVMLSDDATEKQIAKLSSDISAMEDVESVVYISKEDAKAEFAESTSSAPEILEQLGDENPFPANLRVELKNTENVATVAAQIEANKTFLKICDAPDNPSDSVKYAEQTSAKLIKVSNYVRYGSIALVALLVLAALIFINNTIRLAVLARRREISIMRLVGASKGYIRGPFVMEGALQGIIGAGLAILAIVLVKNLLMPKLATTISFLPIALTNSQYTMICLVLLGAGLVIGLLGSAIAIRRHLKV